MADERLFARRMGKPLGLLALSGLLIGGAALFAPSCTDNSGNGNFVEPHPGAGADSGADAGTSADARADATDGNTDHPVTTDGSVTDGLASDLATDLPAAL
jgi:hypothetical protein